MSASHDSRLKRGFAALVAAALVASGALLAGPTAAFAEQADDLTGEVIETQLGSPESTSSETEGDELVGDSSVGWVSETDEAASDEASSEEASSDEASSDEAAADETSQHDHAEDANSAGPDGSTQQLAALAQPQLAPLAEGESAAPVITVAFANGAPIDATTPVYTGDEIVVTGTGFAADANIGTRPPLPGMSTGVYVAFGNFADTWQPSEGAPRDARAIVSQMWSLPQASYGHLVDNYPSLAAELAVMNADGSFEVSLVAGDADSEPGTYGVFTYVAGGAASDAVQELEIRVNYQGERPATPAIDVYLEDGETLAGDTPLQAGDTVVIRGTNFDPEANIATGRPPITAGDAAGVYIVFGNFAEAWQPSIEGTSSGDRVGAADAWALTDATFDNIDPRFVSIVEAQRVVMTPEGSFEATLTLEDVPADTPSPENASYGVFTYAAGDAAANPSEELEVRLNYFTENEEFPGEEDPDISTVGGLDWAFVPGWNSYAKSFAAATLTATNGATLVDESTWEVNYQQVDGGDYDHETGLGTIRYQGTVRYVSNVHFFDIALANPWVTFSESGAVITAETSTSDTAGVSSMQRVQVAEISPGTPVAGEGDEVGLLTWAGVSGTVSAGIEPEGWHRYGETSAAISPVTFSFGAGAGIDDGGAGDGGGNGTGNGDGSGDGGGNEVPVVTPPPPATQSAAAGELVWSISRDFAAYAVGTIGRGTVSTTGVASGSQGYTFPQATGGSWNFETQTGTVQYSGVVTFSAHGGLMREVFANPIITVTSPSTGTVTVGGYTFSLDLGAAQRSVGEGGAITFSGVPVHGLISGGGSSGGGSGGGSFGLDSLTFTVGAVNTTNYGNTEVSNPALTREPAETAPTTEGITIVTPLDELVAGGEIEFTASGFEPNETDIFVVLYSEPVLIDDNAQADADGNIRWIGTLPKDVNGEHTITLQGSSDAGAKLTILTQEEYDELHADPEVRVLSASGADDEAVVSAESSAGEEVGSQWIMWAVIIVLLAGAGAAVAVVAAKRRQAT